ncbi:MAG: TatD DNase family protein [Planctomycetota bacterium]|jgi:TatD DNase family protein
MYYDIHSHLNDDKFNNDVDAVIVRMDERSVITNCVGYDRVSSERAMVLATNNAEVSAIVGFHPDYASEYDQELMESWLGGDQVVAVGECGFDWYRVDRAEAYEAQVRVFRAQIELALAYDLPLMIHTRSTPDTMDAYQDVLEVLDEYRIIHGDKLRGDFHFFAGNKEVLQGILDIGFDVSYTGVITWAPEYAELIATTPLDRIHVETDAPYVAPVPYRGKRAEPVHVLEMIKKIAEVKGEDIEFVRDRIYQNGQKLFRRA